MKSQKTGQEKFVESSRIFSGAIKFAAQSPRILLCLSHIPTQFNEFREFTAGVESLEVMRSNAAAEKQGEAVVRFTRWR
jgi:hypothetical protein